jgi:hypothetical protein
MFKSSLKHHVLECFSKEATQKVKKESFKKQRLKECFRNKKKNEQVKK